ncbi:MAG: hypothetical protein M1833_002468 [Piccolia ochrophora]|nr:MAG: hypothetical protein M1833_002468 [Piccolia ochrophora]
MASRPTFINLRSKSHEPSHAAFPSPSAHLSPRIAHADGDIPPTLSPLDAFAAQGRLLARQLDESLEDGKRISRLPPHTIERSLTQARPGVFRSMSADTENFPDTLHRGPHEDAGPGSKTELAVPDFRPVSVYPRMSTIPLHAPNDPSSHSFARANYKVGAMPANARGRLGNDLLPPNFESAEGPGKDGGPATTAGGRNASDQRYINVHRARSDDVPSREGSPDVGSSHLVSSGTLVPPRSPFGRSGSSIRSVPAESSDDDATGSPDASLSSLERKRSSGSGFSPPSPPRSPFVPRPPRSPSISSEYSLGGTRQPRGAMNFSRPMSRASRPSLDMPALQATPDGQPFGTSDDTVYDPVSRNGAEARDSTDLSQGPVPPYIYSRFSLPRGRIVQKTSLAVQDSQSPQHHFHWESPPVPYSNVTLATPPKNDEPSTPSRELSPSSLRRHARSPSIKSSTSSNAEPLRSPRTRPHAGHADDHLHKPPAARASSHGTIKGPSTLSVEGHLAKGIECHEQGSLNESTYHLRIAAKANHPTAMLLYALACRHGWGMRPNPREGVQWLRKAADCAGLEVADDEDPVKEESPADFVERKTRRAQFALSIYELGMSHMKGWGVDPDKVLALRCFEIAGAWGDGDALNEAGFCYAQGVGCKKDLKKSARLYRMAESKGMSMVGNSWIYKAKYMDGESREGQGETKDQPQKKPRDKSKTRTIFARKKSVAGPTT